MLSSTVNFIARELSSIYETSKKPEVLKAFSNKILSVKVPAINNQLQLYQVNGLASIQQEIYEEILQETDFNKFDEIMADIFQKRSFKPIRLEKLHIPKFTYKIPTVSLDIVRQLICGDITSQNFRDYSRQVLDGINDFEFKLCQYKRTVKTLIERYLNHLHEIYMNNYRNKDMKYESFRDYVKSYLEHVLEIQ